MTVIDPHWPGSIGSDQLPGLSKVGEECGELAEIVCKVWGSGGLTHWTGDLKVRIEDEIGDVLAACDFFAAHNLDLARISARRVEKRRLFEEWHRQGTGAH